MAALPDRTPHSHRDDPAVPPFDDGGPVAVMDGACALCGWGARIMVRLDRAGTVRVCPIQSPLGTALARHHGLDPGDPETWLYLENGRAETGMEAIVLLGERLGGVARLVSVLRILPRGMREWLYRRIARNRYRFGRSDICATPDKRLRSRLMP